MTDYEIIDSVSDILNDDKPDINLNNQCDKIVELENKILFLENERKMDNLKNLLSNAIQNRKKRRCASEVTSKEVRSTEVTSTLNQSKNIEMTNITKISHLENTCETLNILLEEKCKEVLHLNKLNSLCNDEINKLRTAYENLEFENITKTEYYTKELEKCAVRELQLLERIRKLENQHRRERRYTCASFF